jgi:peptidyl-prolyl cis-trans isomerase SurA
MKRIITLALGATLTLNACKVADNKPQEATIETLGNVSVPVSQFKYVYNKNNGNDPDAYSEKSLKEYLDLYTNFKLKVIEAQSMGLDTAQSFIKELEGYKKQLAQPYLTEKSVTEGLIKEAYQRMGEEINAAHILITVAPDADPADSLKAYQKITDIRAKAVAGENFEALAVEYSQDPSSKTNKGDLGFFTALQMVYPFEDAAYKTAIGSVSPICRTKFGYHILKVKDRRPSRGEVKVSHIMVRAAEGVSADDSLAAKQKIDEIYAKAKKGDNWDELCAQFSDDLGTKNKGGVLPLFGTNAMIASFEDAAFSLKTPGDFSTPVRTPYGWHIIKLIERKNLPEFKELESSIKAKVSKDSRSDLNKSVLIARLKKENAFAENSASMKIAFAKADTNLVKGKFDYKKEDKDLTLPLFSIKSKNTTVGEFLQFVKDRQRPRPNFSPSHYINLLYKEFTDLAILTYEENNLEAKYPDYKNLVSEYREGILLFQLMDTKVWSKAIQDTLGLQKFFAANQNNYKWNKRLDATIYSCANRATLDQVKATLVIGKYSVNEPKTDDLLFAPGIAKLTKDDSIKLNSVVALLNKDAKLLLEINGYADASEIKTLASTKISLKRAQLVDDFLKAQKVDSSRISVNDLVGAVVSLSNAKIKTSKVGFKYLSTSNTALEKLFNEKQPLAVQVTQGMFQKGDNTNADAIDWKEGDQILEKDGRVILIRVRKVEEPRNKKLEEVKGQTISDYQNYLEKEWISSLKVSYPVKINTDELNKLVKK